MQLKIAVGLGAGGHAKGLIEIIRKTPDIELMGLLDGKAAASKRSLLGFPILGDESSLPWLVTRGATHFFVGLGGVGDNRGREKAFMKGCRSGLEPLSLVHPSVVSASSVRLEPGCAVLPGVILGSDVSVGSNALINSAAVVEHDTHVGPHAHVSIGALVAGGVELGEGAHVGAGAVVLEGRSVGAHALIAAGAVVTRDVMPGERVAGVPARRMDDVRKPSLSSDARSMGEPLL